MPPMAAIQHHLQMSTSAMQSQSRAPLRRAVYIHVSDLTSAYNIDHTKLEQELNRVLANRTPPPPATVEEHSVPYSRTPTPAVDPEESGVVQLPQKRLQPPRGGFNLCVLVGKVKVVVDKLRVDRSRVRLAEVEIGDETGTVSLRARDDQIDVLQEISDRSGAVVLRNCTLELYQGRHLRLAVTKWGKLRSYPDQVASTPPPPSKMNHDRNFSLIDLSLVASEMVDRSSESGFVQSRQKTPEPDSDRHTTSRTMSTRQFQSSQHNRRAVRDRNKQQRQSQPISMHSQVPMGYQDTGVGAAMGYSGVHTFSRGYREEVPPFSYASPSLRPQDANSLSQAPPQLLLQQYELQQQRIQMQMYQEHERRRLLGSQQSHQMQPSSHLHSGAVGSGSFDQGEYQVSSLKGGADHHPSAVPVAGTNQLLIPISRLAPGSSRGSSGEPQQETYGDSIPGQRSRVSRQSNAPSDVGTFSTSESDQRKDRTWPDSAARIESPPSPGRMNPQATAFAPTYIQSQGALAHQMQSTAYTYVPYDPTQQVPANMYGSPSLQHPGVYAQGLVYVPAVHAVTGGNPSATSSEQETQGRRDFQPIEETMPPGREAGTPSSATEASDRKSHGEN